MNGKSGDIRTRCDLLTKTCRDREIPADGGEPLVDIVDVFWLGIVSTGPEHKPAGRSFFVELHP